MLTVLVCHDKINLIQHIMLWVELKNIRPVNLKLSETGLKAVLYSYCINVICVICDV